MARLSLGDKVQQAREERGWNITDVTSALEGMGAGKVALSTIYRMEKGERSGDPVVWGKLWILFDLPLNELYEGLGLPVAPELPTGALGETLAIVSSMPEEMQKLAVELLRCTPQFYGAAKAGFGLAKPPSVGQQTGTESRLWETGLARDELRPILKPPQE